MQDYSRVGRAAVKKYDTRHPLTRDEKLSRLATTSAAILTAVLCAWAFAQVILGIVL